MKDINRPSSNPVAVTYNAFSEDEQEYLAEREAIAEHDGGLDKEPATLLAYSCYVHKYRPVYKRYYPLP